MQCAAVSFVTTWLCEIGFSSQLVTKPKHLWLQSLYLRGNSVCSSS